MAKNFIEDIAFGASGSTYITAAAAEVVAPSPQVYVAIYMLTNTIFTNTGLKQAGQRGPTTYIGSEGIGVGTNGTVTDGVTFPAGVTIYGKWKSIDLASGSCIAYLAN